MAPPIPSSVGVLITSAPQRVHQRLLLDAEALGDDEDGVDAELSGGDGEPDAGVARGGLDDGAALGELPESSIASSM